MVYRVLIFTARHLYKMSLARWEIPITELGEPHYDDPSLALLSHIEIQNPSEPRQAPAKFQVVQN